MQPVQLCDRIEAAKATAGITLTCSNAALPVDETNLVHKAAAAFLSAACAAATAEIAICRRSHGNCSIRQMKPLFS